jgi:hypothetical protein
LCALLFAAVVAVAHYAKVRPPNYVFVLLLGLAFLQMALVGWLTSTDNEQMRREMQEINPAAVSHLVVSSGGFGRRAVPANEVASLFGELQQVQAVPAHHSHPVDSFDLEFQVAGNHFAYSLGRDSDRMDEYWVLEVARAGTPGREIGRIQAPELGQLLEALAHAKTPQP